jgi:chemotaxis protein MotB
MERKPEEPKSGAPEYMLTYGDMMTLLLCFFVLLFSFSTIEKKDFQHIVSAFQDAIGVMPGTVALNDGQGKMPKSNLMIHHKKGLEKSAGGTSFVEASNDKKLESQMQGALDEFVKEGDVQIVLSEHGLILRLKGALAFDKGSAHLTRKMVEVLARIAEVLQRDSNVDKLLIISGHTDNNVISNLDYPSNWELSSHRAVNAARYLIEEERKNRINPARIRIQAYSMYKPSFVNSKDGNPDNRRVEITVIPRSKLKGKGQDVEVINKDFEKMNEY